MSREGDDLAPFGARSTGRCIVGRTARLELQKVDAPARLVTIAFPSDWSEEALLEYVRTAHPNEGVNLVEWAETHPEGSREPHLWLARPSQRR